MNENLPQITLTQAKDFLIAWIAAGNRKPVILWGAPGVGKSAVTQSIPPVLEQLTGNPWKLIDLRLSQLDPVDLRGVPSVASGMTVWNTPDWFPTAEKDGDHGILFLDEMFLAAPSVLHAAYELLQDHRIGDAILPSGWIVLAASNRPEDKAGLSSSFNAAVANRFVAHVDCIVDIDAWIDWALDSGIVPEMIAFIRFVGDRLLHQYANGGIPKGTVAYATPRSWEAASDLLKLKMSVDLEQAMLEGCVGRGPAAELVGFLEVMRSIPDVGNILAHPETAEVPEDPSTKYALTVLLSKRTTLENFGAVITYLTRISADFCAVAVKDAVARNEALRETKAFIKFKVDNQELFLETGATEMRRVSGTNWAHRCSKNGNREMYGPANEDCPHCGQHCTN